MQAVEIRSEVVMANKNPLFQKLKDMIKLYMVANGYYTICMNEAKQDFYFCCLVHADKTGVALTEAEPSACRQLRNDCNFWEFSGLEIFYCLEYLCENKGELLDVQSAASVYFNNWKACNCNFLDLFN